MKNKEPKPKKAKALNLGQMTCAQLVEWLETPLNAYEVQPEKNLRLRHRYENPRLMRLLKLCGPLNARHHDKHVMTARHLASVPSIEMKVAGGKPDETKMPPFTASLKKIGAINGYVVHRWGKGAFILAHPLKEEPVALRAGELV